MLFLEKVNDQIYINIDNKDQATIDSLSSEQLLQIFENVYTNKDFYEDIDPNILNSIHNPVQKEVIIQIVKKVEDFKRNVDEIHHEIEISFPKIQVTDL